MTSVSTDRRFGVNSGKAVKVPCKVATTANITLSGEQTIDGVACVTGDRVLVRTQTTGSENGIWVVDTGSWSRALDFDDVLDVTEGTLIPINQGTTYAIAMFRVNTTGTITPGSTSISFSHAMFNDAANISFTQAGSGAVTYSVQNKLREFVNVVDFGADKTGVSNSTTAFNNASAVGVPLVPSGTYLITGTIRGMFFSFGPVTISGGSVTSIIDLSRIGANFRYNDGINLLRSLRAGSLNIGGGIDSRGDSFFDATGIDATNSLNETRDTRGAYTPTRSGSENVYADLCDSLASWTGISTGTGNAAVVADPDPDPAIGNVFDFTTGATLASIGGTQKDVGSIPASYGIQFLVKLNAVGTDPTDALEIAIGNINSYNTILRLYNSAFEVFQDGAYRLLFSHGGNFYTEWWVQVTQISGASHKVDLYAGTQLVGSRTGALPGGATDGLVVFQQKSAATINRESRIAVINIGTSQLADNLTLISNAYPARFSPTIVRTVFLIEDTSVALNTNTNLTAQVSQNDGVSWENITLQKVDLYSLGVIDSSKNIWVLIAEHVFTNIGATNLRWKLVSTQNWWFAVVGAYMEWL